MSINEENNGLDDILTDINSMVEKKEVLDRTQVYLRLIDALKNLDMIEGVQEILKNTFDLVGKLTQIIITAPEVQSKALDTYGHILETYIDDEDMARNKRLREMLGFGSKRKDEAIGKAREEFQHILSDLERSSVTANQILLETNQLMSTITKQLDGLLDRANLDEEAEKKLNAIREQIRSQN